MRREIVLIEGPITLRPIKLLGRIDYLLNVLSILSDSLLSKRFRGVWEQRKTEERDFRCVCRAKNGARDKKRKRGVGEGNEGTACRQTPGF